MTTPLVNNYGTHAINSCAIVMEMKFPRYAVMSFEEIENATM